MPDVYFNRNRKNPPEEERPRYRNRGERPEQRTQYRQPQHREPQRSAPRPQYRQSGGYRNQPPRGRGPQQPVAVRRKKQRHPIRNIFIILLVLFLIYAIIAHAIFGAIDYNGKVHRGNQYISSISLRKSPGVKNILLLGVDARPGETISRADTMMLVTIDKHHKEIKLTSFLRDSYVEIPGHGMNKLNASCSEGGIQLVIDTIEYNYRIKINNYAAVNFEAFEELIDALGGVDVPVTYREASYLNRTWYKWSLTGTQLHFDYGDKVHLNGEKALMFCRIRKLDSDIERTRRQRLVVSAVKDKMSGLSTMERLNAIRKCLPYVQTDLHSINLMNLAIGAGLRYKNYEILQKSVPESGLYRDEYTNAGSSLVFDIDVASDRLKDFVFGDGTEQTGSTEYSIF